MKSQRRLLALSLLSFSPTMAQTVTITDNFSAGTNWTSVAAAQQGTSALSISGGQVNYISASPASNNSTILKWTAMTMSYTTDWQAQIDVHARSYASGDNYFYGSLVAFKSGSLASSSTIDMISADIMRPNAGDYSAFQTSYYVNGARTETPKTDLDANGVPNGIANSTTDGALRLTFDSSTKVLTAYFDPDGSAGGYSWTPISSIDVDGAQNWSMTNGSTFTLGLEATSGLNVYANGDVYFDNFSVTAVPEPSTYAAWFALAALGFAAYRRRGRAM